VWRASSVCTSAARVEALPDLASEKTNFLSVAHLNAVAGDSEVDVKYVWRLHSSGLIARVIDSESTEDVLAEYGSLSASRGHWSQGIV